MPLTSTPGDDNEDGSMALELGLERVRLMILAEEDPAEIRRVWNDLGTESEINGALRTRFDELRILVDGLPNIPKVEQPSLTLVS